MVRKASSFQRQEMKMEDEVSGPMAIDDARALILDEVSEIFKPSVRTNGAWEVL